MAWNGSDGVKAPKIEEKKHLAIGKGLIAGLVVVVVAVTWFIYFSNSSMVAEKDEADKTKAIAEVDPQINKVQDGSFSAFVKESKDKKSPMDKLEAIERPQIKVRKLTEEEWYSLTNRTFKTGVEQLMSWVFSVEIGDMPIPIPSIGEEDRKNIVSILISDNPIKDTDDERAKFCKENVMAAKKEMMKYLKEGGDPDEFLQYYFQELKYAFDKRNEARNQIQEVWEEDPELGKKFLEQVNKSFAEEGIKVINEMEVSE